MEYFGDLSGVFQGSLWSNSRIFLECPRNLFRVPQGSFSGVLKMFLVYLRELFGVFWGSFWSSQGSFWSISGIFLEYLKDLFEVSQGSFRSISRIYLESFKDLFGVPFPQRYFSAAFLCLELEKISNILQKVKENSMIMVLKDTSTKLS